MWPSIPSETQLVSGKKTVLVSGSYLTPASWKRANTTCWLSKFPRIGLQAMRDALGVIRVALVAGACARGKLAHCIEAGGLQLGLFAQLQTHTKDYISWLFFFSIICASWQEEENWLPNSSLYWILITHFFLTDYTFNFTCLNKKY